MLQSHHLPKSMWRTATETFAGTHLARYVQLAVTFCSISQHHLQQHRSSSLRSLCPAVAAAASTRRTTSAATDGQQGRLMLACYECMLTALYSFLISSTVTSWPTLTLPKKLTRGSWAMRVNWLVTFCTGHKPGAGAALSAALPTLSMLLLHPAFTTACHVNC
jgi:hypothetical protein